MKMHSSTPPARLLMLMLAALTLLVLSNASIAQLAADDVEKARVPIETASETASETRSVTPSATPSAAPEAAQAQPVDAPAAVRIPNHVVPGSELENMSGPLLRMVLSLLAVLAVLGVCAWLARRVRGTQIQGGLIQIVSGLSLGPKEKVVLLRVGDDQVLVGLSSAGMQPLHVVGNAPPAQPFSLDMAQTSSRETQKEHAS